MKMPYQTPWINNLNKIRVYGPFQSVKFLLREIFYRLWNQLLLDSYGQGKEDLNIDKILGNKDRGFYVDIGASDPIRFNNTYRFYKRGWQGINVEPNLQSFRKLKEQRKRDLNLNFLVGIKKLKTFFYEFDPGTLSTMSERLAKKYQKLGFKMTNRKKVGIKRLSKIFSQYLHGRSIDFMSIDTEGSDLEVLKSNDWNRYRPLVLCVESSVRSLKKAVKLKDNNSIKSFLKKVGYRQYFDNGVNKIFLYKSLYFPKSSL